ncbi:unnamed protein product [Vitrella brassicaformis CCMP3155]|uniref:Uncharacterized protein n=1 Tax=Vitrella brassicaformis (strain CCMP3155) TaxID=1169540 RepID=A0A0G4FP38_VITBC|nr:unnamed protein product [Vitrella brassicaformis CCMP3155]|eukprot:CEM15968.1 unnamed protein product [Vitrella brassicaformis CCMP3155]
MAESAAVSPPRRPSSPRSARPMHCDAEPRYVMCVGKRLSRHDEMTVYPSSVLHPSLPCLVAAGYRISSFSRCAPVAFIPFGLNDRVVAAPSVLNWCRPSHWAARTAGLNNGGLGAFSDRVWQAQLVFEQKLKSENERGRGSGKGKGRGRRRRMARAVLRRTI